MTNTNPMGGDVVTASQHLSKAREFIAKGDGYYRKAAVEIMAAQAEGWSNVAIARELGRTESWVRALVASAIDSSPDTSADDDLAVDWKRGSHATREEIEQGTPKVLADDDRRRSVIAKLDNAQLEAVIQDAHEVVIERHRAERAEVDTTPTARELMGGDPFDPSESWTDESILRVRKAAFKLTEKVRKWGVVLGSMDTDKAFAYVQEAEAQIADVRAALQERIADESTVA